jgi:gliding motility-associated-like protein
MKNIGPTPPKDMYILSLLTNAKGMTNNLFFAATSHAVKCLALVALIAMSTIGQAQTTVSFNTGSVIINMSGGTYNSAALSMNIANSTVANTIKPFGLIYEILKAKKAPIYVIIKKSKLNDEFDFTHNNFKYGGGSFIIPKEYVTGVQANITTWNGKGVLTAVTNSQIDFNLSDYTIYKLTYAPQWAVSNLSDNKTDAFFTNSEIPISSYAVKEVVNSSATPDLDKCDDIILFPHNQSDLTYAKLSPLLNWNKNYKGALWGGCQSTFVLESVFFSSEGKYVLSTGGIQKHETENYPYEYNLLPIDPIAQYSGKSSSGDVGGNTEAYELLSGSTWRASTKVITRDEDDFPVNSYGRVFGEADRGYAFWQAGHIDVTAEADILGQRMFFNYSFYVANEKIAAYIPNSEITLTTPNGTPVKSGDQISLSVDSYTGSQTLSYSWSVSPVNMGSFVTGTASTTTATFNISCSVATQTTVDFTVKATDDCGRTTFETTSVIINPNPIVPTLTPTNVTCRNGNNGEIEAAVTGGRAPYTYLWSNSQTASTTINLTAGTYSVTVTDANGCSATASATITEPLAALSATISSTTAVDCFGGSDGAIDLSVTGGTASYTYSWSNSAVTQDLTSLTAGTYSVTVTDGNGCTATASTTVSQPLAALSATISGTTYVSCNGGSNGAIDLTVTGGTATYTYSWSNSQTTQDISGLAAGTYSVTVTDANGCSATASATITEPLAALSSTISSTTAVDCFGGSDGAIDLSVTGGTASYTYSWSNSAMTQDLTSLTAGTYSVTVTDGNGCTSTVTATVSEPALALTSSISGTVSVTCFGLSNGSATVLGGDGTSPYTYLWSNTQTGTTATGLSVGDYGVRITDANGCTSTATATVSEPAAVSIGTVTLTSYNGFGVKCFGNNDGSITLGVSGGTGVGTYSYTYSKDGGSVLSNGSNNVFSNLTAGTHSLTVTDGNGCSATSSATLSEPSVVSNIAYALTQPDCVVVTGTVSITSSLSGLIFTLTGSSTTASNTLGFFENVIAGTYSLTATNSITGCVSPEETFLVNPQPTAASATVSKTDILCYGDNTGAISLTISGGIAPYAYNWSNGETSDEVLGVGAGTYTITGLSAGTYTITVTENGGGCTTTVTTTINQPDFTLSGTFTPTNISCKGGNTGSIDLTPAGGTGPYTYAWLGPDGYTSTNEDLTDLVAGNYSVTITDANKCTAVVTETINEPGSAFSATISSTATEICADGSVTLTASAGSSYLWSNSSANSSITVSQTTTTSYTVTVTSADNCTAEATYTVTVNPLPTITTAASAVCLSNTIDLNTSDVGGSWATASSTIATVDVTGVVTGISEGTVTITYTNDNGCSFTKLITVNPLPSVLSVTDASRAGTGTLTLSATPSLDNINSSSGATINWYQYPDDIIPIATATTSYTTGVISTTTNYHVEAKNITTGCVSASRAKVVAYVSGTIEPGDITSAQSFCGPGDPEMLVSLNGEEGYATIDPVAPISYQWYSSTNNITYVKIDAATDTTYDPGLLSVTTWFKREASATVGIKLTSDSSNPIKITINPVVDVPVISATASTTFCQGGAIELTATTSTASVTYQWSLNLININGADKSKYTADSSGAYSVKVTDASTGCSATSSPSFTVTENVLPSIPTINWRVGDTTTFCVGDTIILTSSVTASAYRWFDGASITPLNTDVTSKSFTVTTSCLYTLEIENEFGCTRQASSSVSVTVNALPAIPTISANGSLDFCPGDSVKLTSSSATHNQWYHDGNLISGATADTLNAKTAGSYSLIVTNANNCSSSTATSTVVTIYTAPPKPVINASGTATFCKGDSVVLSSTGSGTFQWFKNGTKLTDSTRSELVVDSAGTYSVQVTSTDGCLSEISDGSVVATNDIPSFIVAITVCKGKVIQLIGSLTAANVNPWMSSNSAIASIDALGQLTANDKGSVQITYRNSNGCSIAREIDVNVAPAMPDSISGAGLVTPGSTILFSVPPVSGSTTYAWSFPSGWSSTDSANIATAKPNGKSGNVAVVASENGCTSGTVIFLVTVDSTDTDKDGIYDLLDLDNDNDGILDQVEFDACDPSSIQCDTDNDGTPNRYDLDSDGDGITDVYEADGTDVNKDGIADGPVDGDGVPISADGGLAPPDTDKDGNLDPYDVDSDNDGIPDSTEAGSDPKTPRDTDRDGIPDFRELDSDNDGIPDSTEAGSDPTKPRDTDGDGYADYIDLDSDNDGIRDKVENGNGPSELDTDRDKIPDYLDLDSDADGITDVVESDGTDANKDGRSDGASDSNGIPASANGGVTPPDTDKDGRRDFQDVDSDGDGIPDNIEGQDTYITFKGKDTDKDGLDDAYDNDGGNYISPVDTDDDAKPDYRDLDSDMDGIPDSVEKGPDGNNPRNTDGTDKPDYRDKDSDNDTIPDVVEAVDGNTDPATPVDTDNDGLPDYRDLDSENDTIPDIDEAGPNPNEPANTDGIDKPDFRDEDSNNNGIPDGETLLIWKKASTPKMHSPMGEMEITFTIILTNQRPEPITDVQIKENLNVTFPSPMTFRLGSVVSNGILTPSNSFNGTTNINMLQSGITLQGYQQDSIVFTVIFNPSTYSSEIRNMAEGTAMTKWWPVTRNSIDIVNSNGRKHGPGDPTESQMPIVDIMLPDVITPNGDGFNDKLVIQRPAGVKVKLVVFSRWGSAVYKNNDYQNDWDGKVSNGGSSNSDLAQGTYYYIVEFTGAGITGKLTKKSYLTVKKTY